MQLSEALNTKRKLNIQKVKQLDNYQDIIKKYNQWYDVWLSDDYFYDDITLKKAIRWIFSVTSQYNNIIWITPQVDLSIYKKLLHKYKKWKLVKTTWTQTKQQIDNSISLVSMSNMISPWYTNNISIYKTKNIEYKDGYLGEVVFLVRRNNIYNWIVDLYLRIKNDKRNQIKETKSR